MKKDILKAGEFYHIFNKSIAGYGIFSEEDSPHFLKILLHYNTTYTPPKLSCLSTMYEDNVGYEILIPGKNSIVKFISYCIMPTHYHLLIKVLDDKKIHHFLNNVGNCYTRYFNLKFKRKGPLWQTSYQAVRIITNEQLLHVSRYIHLNSTTAGLVENPEDWEFSSYRNYIYKKEILSTIMSEISINSPLKYKQFVENHKNYQIKLKGIKKLIME